MFFLSDTGVLVLDFLNQDLLFIVVVPSSIYFNDFSEILKREKHIFKPVSAEHWYQYKFYRQKR